jgi:hypothetical protein
MLPQVLHGFNFADCCEEIDQDVDRLGVVQVVDGGSNRSPPLFQPTPHDLGLSLCRLGLLDTP